LLAARKSVASSLEAAAAAANEEEPLTQSASVGWSPVEMMKRLPPRRQVKLFHLASIIFRPQCARRSRIMSAESVGPARPLLLLLLLPPPLPPLAVLP